MCTTQICSKCVTLSCKYEPKSWRNVSSSRLNLCLEEFFKVKNRFNPDLAMCTYQSDLRNKSNWTSLSFSKIPHLLSEKLGGESKVFKAQLKLSLKWEIDLVLIMCLFKLSQDVKKAIGHYQQRFCVKPLRLSNSKNAWHNTEETPRQDEGHILIIFLPFTFRHLK